jgi:TetR/AcrR family transcriptional regulator, transcriptional repressor for nem operon
MRKGVQTRQRILAVAECSVLAKGFGATSIDEVIAGAGITKSGFFYHFRDKSDLARSMLERYVAENDRIFDDVFGRGRELSDDPLHAFLIGLKLLAEVMSDLPRGHPGCLIATYCYQERLFDREIKSMTAAAVKRWNFRFLAAFEEIARAHPPRQPVDMEDLAEMFSCVVDGGIIMSKALDDPHRLERQIMLFRGFVKMLFCVPSPVSEADGGEYSRSA